MKVIFLDFDGVLNSQGSFIYETARRRKRHEIGVKGPVNETLCNVCTANFQTILDTYRDVKIVISSTWREMFDLDWLRAKLASYHIDSSRVIGKTPSDWGGNRGIEIQLWLNAHPEVTHYIVIDDNTWGIPEIHGEARFVKTTWDAGLTFDKAEEAIEKLSSKHRRKLELEAEEKAEREKDGRN